MRDHDISQRRACRLVGVDPKIVRRDQPPDNPEVHEEMKAIASKRRWLELHLPGKVSNAGATAKDNRMFLEAVFWRVRTGSPWRDLPPAFGHWNSQLRRFRRWARSGVFESLFKAMSGDVDLEYALIDGTIVQVHQKATGAKGGLNIRPSGARVAD